MWAAEEKVLLKELYPDHSDMELCEILKKTPGQIRGMKSRLGLRGKQCPFTSEERDYIRAYYENHIDSLNLDALSKEMGRQKTSISRVARSMGLTDQGRSVPDEVVRKTQESMKRYRTSENYLSVVYPKQCKTLAYYAKNSHPRGMLGKTHTDEARVRISTKQRDLWDSFSDAEKKARLQHLRVWSRVYGHQSDRNTYSRCKRGIREDIGIFVRSSWEANVARLMTYLNIEWEYEPMRFYFPDEGDSILSYCPDFYLPQTGTFIEVKGWMDPNSISRIDKFSRYFQTQYEHFILIDSVVYDSLEKHFGNIVDNWEFTKNSYKRIEEKENEHGTEDTV